ncbi:MAG: trypsin-like serine protease [Arthrobacter sp.]|nr:trypsin-like serine protease [Arthrobacter sp.]
MTLEEFNAAGEQAKRAAHAAPSLRGLPGYAGISLKDGRIVVEGSGAELQAKVDQLNQAGPAADFVLAVPRAAAPATPSAAPATPPAAAPLASSTEQLFQAYVRDVGPAGLQAVAYTDGHFVIRTGGTNTPEAGPPSLLDPLPASASTPAAAPGKISPAEFVARYANVQLEKGARIKTEEDLFGGQGYVVDGMSICSAGFGAFTPAGEPVALTAGHCAEDGAAKAAAIEPPGSAPAGGSTTPVTGPLAPLGTFGFSQFGGPKNSWITGAEADPGNVGTDIAVLDSLRPGLSLRPAVTRWNATTADEVSNPGPTAVKIVGLAAPVLQQDVCRSGRTAGWSCGQVDEIGIYVVGGRTADPGDLRAFRGFLSHSVQSSGGDSGGPWISGNYAVGTHSAGDSPQPNEPVENFAIATTLEDAMAQIPGGVELQLFLNKPELVAPANATFLAGEPVTGRVPAAPASAIAANSKVRITVAGQQPVELPVDAAGNWSFPTPSSTGRFQFSAETVNGFSRSGAASLSVNVSDLRAPEITSPSEGAELKAVDRVEGTGTAGYTVLLSGDLTGSGVVSPDGRWSISVAGQGVYGKISVVAGQTAPDHEHGPSVTRNVTVTPPAPAFSSIPDGVHFSQDRLPETISGAGVDGAEVTVLIDGVPVGAGSPVLVAGGRWSVPLPAGLGAGAHTLSVSQSVDGVPSAAVAATFTVRAPAVEAAPVVPAALPAPAAVAAPVQPGGAGQLPDTGAGALLPSLGLGAGALLIGGALVFFGRRRVLR